MARPIPQKLGRNENRVNEKRNVTKVRVRGEEQDLVEGDMIAPRIQRLIQRDGRPVLQKGSTTGLWPDGGYNDDIKSWIAPLVRMNRIKIRSSD